MLTSSRLLLVSAVVCALVVVGLLGITVARCGSVSNAFRYISGKRVVVELVESVPHEEGYLPDKIKEKATDDSPPGPPVSHSFKLRLRNLSGERIKVIGSESTCSCMATTNLPEAVEPWGTADFTVWATGGEWPQQQMRIHTTSEYNPTVSIAFSR